MAAIEEADLKANLYVETSPVQATASWTNHIDTVRNINLTRGGVEPFIGVNNVEVGSGTITLVNNSATIEPGYWVRLRYSSTNFWAGFVQDVNTTYRFINNVQYAVKTLVVMDWVGWISQYSFADYESVGTSWWTRLQKINLQIDSTAANKPLIEYPSGTATSWQIPQYIGQTSVAEILDLLSNSVTGGYWMSTTTVPTGSTSGIDSLIRVYNVPGSFGGDATFTDGTHTGTPTDLIYYTDIEMSKKTSAVVNNAVINASFAVDGEMVETEYQRPDSTSVATYGSRLATIDVGISSSRVDNLFPYPSFEDYLNRTEDTNFYYSAEEPSKDSAGAWSAWNGSWAYRAFAKTTAVPTVALPLSEVVEVTAGVTFYGFAYAAASAGLNSRARFFIQWQDDQQAIISTSYGSYVNHTSLKTWYKTSNSATAPANAVYARVGLQFSRTTGANIGANSKYWTDGLYFGATNVTDWFSGDTADTSTYLYGWYGAPNASESFRMTNYLYVIANEFLTDNKNPKYAPLMLRINAQDNLTKASALDLYAKPSIWLSGSKWFSVITGINHEISINADGTTRWMIDLILRPSTAV
jgi:hypothetical protein